MKNFIKTHVQLCKFIIMFIFPFVLSALYLSVRGIFMGDLYLPASDNNDVIFYYKIVEGILADGMPRGYFGYNESHAIIGSLGAWNPLLYVPWVVWGGIFGWNYNAMLMSNLFFFGGLLGACVVIAKMSWKQMGFLMLFLSMFPSVSLHLLSGLPEIYVTGVLCVYVALAYSLEHGVTSKGKVNGLVLLGMYLTIIRPYLLVLMLFPFYYLFKENKRIIGLLKIVLILVFTILVYYFSTHYFTASYFFPLFDTSLIELFIKGQWGEMWGLVINDINTVIPEFMMFLKDGFRIGGLLGTHYTIAAVGLVIFVIDFIVSKNNEKKKVYVIYILEIVGLFAAILLLLGSAKTGGRHFFSVAVAGIVLCVLYTEKKTVYIANIFMGVILALFLIRGSLIPDYYDVPVKSEQLSNKIKYWEAIFNQEKIEATDKIGYENTVIWLYWDWNGVDFQEVPCAELYALPNGFGISCCWSDYVYTDWQNLQSKYIASIPGGNVEDACLRSGYTEIGRTDTLIIFKRY